MGTIKPRVSAFMKELDEELWKLGLLAKTKHNGVAPAQHELEPGATPSQNTQFLLFLTAVIKAV